MFRVLLLSLLSLSIFLTPDAYAQTLNGNFTYGGSNRVYVYHVSSEYLPSKPAPLVLALHGLGDTGNNFMLGTGFNAVSDTAGFIVVYPTALPDPILGGNGWNNGLNPLATTDDVGFLNALLDTIIANYNIDLTKIYCTGFSMGSFMTHRLACDMSDRLAAVAGVSGTLPGTIATACNADRPVPVLHMHGTGDETVPYEGLSIPPIVEMSSVDFTMEFWRDHNNCDAAPINTALPNTTSDGYDIELIEYSNCDDDTEVLLYKINNGPHTWLYQPVNDIDATDEIWRFFLRHSLSDPNPPTGIDVIQNENLSVFPVPFDDQLHISSSQYNVEAVYVYDISGKLVLSDNSPSSHRTLNTSFLENGFYVVKVRSENNWYVQKLLKQ